MQQNGGVYFTNKQNVYYYMDDCTPSDAQCERSAAPLLAASLQARSSAPPLAPSSAHSVTHPLAPRFDPRFDTRCRVRPSRASPCRRRL